MGNLDRQSVIKNIPLLIPALSLTIGVLLCPDSLSGFNPTPIYWGTTAFILASLLYLVISNNSLNIYIIAKTKRASFQNETSKSSLFSLPFFSGRFDRLNTN